MEDMLISCIMEFKGNWDEHLPLAEFAYNNSYQSSIDMALFEPCIKKGAELRCVGMIQTKGNC